MRKSLSLLIILLSVIATASRAQTPTGFWTHLPVFGNVEAMAETKDKVFFLTGGCLYHYDKEYDEVRVYLPSSDLSGSNVAAIYASPSGNRIAVVFDDANIDILYPDGRRDNLPDIKYASLDEEKIINDIAFDPSADRMYVATSFGLVVFDLNRCEVKESGLYHHPVTGLMVTPTHLLLGVPPSDNAPTPYYSISKDQSIRNFKNFTPVRSVWAQTPHWYPTDDTSTQFAGLFYPGMPGTAAVSTDGTVTFRRSSLSGDLLVPTARDGVLLITPDNTICSFSDANTETVLVSSPVGMLDSQKIAARDGLGSIWIADRSGMGRISVDGSGNVKVLSEKYLPRPATSFKQICSLFPTADGNGIIAMNMGGNSNHPVGKGDHQYDRIGCDIIIPGDDEFVTIDPDNATAVTSPGMDAVRKYGPHIFAPTFIAESPFEKGTYFIGTSQEGVYVVRDNEIIAKWDAEAGIHKIMDYRYDVQYGCFDPEGNLWLGIYTYSNKIPSVRILPASKVKNPSHVTASDWLIPDLGESLSDRDTRILHCRNSDMTFIIDANFYGELVALYNAGTYSNLSDDRHVVWNNFIDQDGKTYPNVALTCLTEDNEGRVWVGTLQGIFIINNPTTAILPDFRVTRPKVPRNDGTNLADYLLDGEIITSIAVDHAGRKLVGTNGSGLFLVSANGDEVIANYTPENSLLSTATITSLFPYPDSNIVYVGTLDGLFMLASGASPARADFSDVYAYPNPVTPDYTGWITITGLMENSLVKIMDSGMHLVATLTSDGGMAVWDGCNLSGDRVRSGVYYVLASSGRDGTATAGDVVTKILVID